MALRILSFLALTLAATAQPRVVLLEGDHATSSRAIRAAQATEVFRPGLSDQQALAIVSDDQARQLRAAGLRPIALPASALTQDRLALCGNITPSISPGNRPPESNTQYPGPGWDGEGNVGSALLTYAFGNMSPVYGFSADTNKADFLAAAAVWSSVAAVDLVPAQLGQTADIRAFFGPNDHGDWSFNGALAHAVPKSSLWPPDQWGGVHFNNEYHWGNNYQAREWRLACVALHELGHALFRMGHSDDITSIMYPYIGASTCNINGEDTYFARLEFAARYNPLRTFPPALPGDPGSGGGGGDRGDRGGVAFSLSVSAPSTTTEPQVFVTVTPSGGTTPYFMRYSLNGSAPTADIEIGSPYLIGPIDLALGTNTVAVTVRDSAAATDTKIISIERTAGDGRSGR